MLRTTLFGAGRFLLLLILFLIFYVGGAQFVSGHIPDVVSEPGLLSAGPGLLLIGIVNTAIVILLVRSSRWNGWKLALSLAFAWYGTVTFMMQIETWYFLSGLTVTNPLLVRLFLMGVPVALGFIPAAVWVLGKGANETDVTPVLKNGFSAAEWAKRIAIIVVAYLVLYWNAGYFIAWQNPELRAFYGSPGQILPFWDHLRLTLQHDPGLFPFQVLRALLWTAFALPIIRGSKYDVWLTSFIVALVFSIPQNVGHVIENPLIPYASVRLSHLVETASSTFVFGFIVSWLLYPRRVPAPKAKEQLG